MSKPAAYILYQTVIRNTSVAARYPSVHTQRKTSSLTGSLSPVCAFIASFYAELTLRHLLVKVGPPSLRRNPLRRSVENT